MSSAKASTPAAANSSEPLPTATAGGVPPSYYSRCGGSTAVVHKDYTGVPTDAAIRACKHGVAIHWYPSSRRVPNRGNMPALLHSWASLNINAAENPDAPPSWEPLRGLVPKTIFLRRA